MVCKLYRRFVQYQVDGQRCRGRSRKTWMQCVEEDTKLVKLCGDDVQDRVDWRIGIRGDRLTRASTEKHGKTMMMMMTHPHQSY